MTGADTKGTLEGLRILILEDSFLVAQDLAGAVSKCGCTVLGPLSSAKKAIDLLDSGTCDGAILDINLGGGTAEPVADRLRQRQIPFFFLTGYAEDTPLGERHAQVRLLRKPVDPDTLCDTMRAEFCRPAGPE